jgi:acetylglutamate kinase
VSVVLKIGGSLQNQMIPALKTAISVLQSSRIPVAVVHGGGPRISAALAQENMTLPFENGIRMTPPAAMPIVESALFAGVNADLATELTAQGFAIVRENGANGIFRVKSTPMFRTGKIEHVHVGKVLRLMLADRVPVIAPLGYDLLHLHYNINADVATAHLAGALKAQKVIFCTDVPGIYSDFERGEKLSDTTPSVLNELLLQHKFTNGMIPKVESVLLALEMGASSVYVVDGQDEESMLWAVCDNPAISSLETENHAGTRIVQETERQMAYAGYE